MTGPDGSGAPPGLPAPEGRPPSLQRPAPEGSPPPPERHPWTPQPRDEPTAADVHPWDPEGPPPEGPPGGRIFSLEGRRAPGLYLVAWILSVGGLVLTFLVGPMASSDAVRFVLMGIGVLLIALGLSAGAGSQVLERRDRHPDRYRGPAPLLLFGAYYFAVSLLGLVLVGGGLVDADDPVGFLVVGSLQVIGYVVVVLLFVVRTGALSWSQMGWPSWAGRDPSAAMRGIGTAVVVMLPTTTGVLLLGGLLGLLLDVEAPDVLPATETAMGTLAVVAAAVFILPIGEELFFRGFMLTAWLRDLGPRSALLRSSFFFALIHIANITATTFTEGAAQALLQTAVILPVGFVLGWLFLRHGMAGAIAGHVTYNGLLLSLALLATRLPQPA